MDLRYWAVLSAAWLIGGFGGGAALAWLYKRLYPSLAFYKLWAMWTMLLCAAVTLILAFS